jgi:hypothetical protein
VNAESCLASHRRFCQGIPYPDPWAHHGDFDHRVWAVGDAALTDLIAKLPAIFGGLGLAALGAKVNDASRPAPQTAKSSKAK